MDDCCRLVLPYNAVTASNRRNRSLMTLPGWGRKVLLLAIIPVPHNLNIRDAEIDIDRNYCVNCHPLSNGRALLSKSPETKMGYRSVQNCKQIHNKYAIYCHICKEPELHNELISPHDLIRKYRNGTLKLKTHPHERDCLNTTIYPVWCKHRIT